MRAFDDFYLALSLSTLTFLAITGQTNVAPEMKSATTFSAASSTMFNRTPLKHFVSPALLFRVPAFYFVR